MNILDKSSPSANWDFCLTYPDLLNYRGAPLTVGVGGGTIKADPAVRFSHPDFLKPRRPGLRLHALTLQQLALRALQVLHRRLAALAEHPYLSSCTFLGPPVERLE